MFVAVNHVLDRGGITNLTSISRSIFTIFVANIFQLTLLGDKGLIILANMFSGLLITFINKKLFKPRFAESQKDSTQKYLSLFFCH